MIDRERHAFLAAALVLAILCSACNSGENSNSHVSPSSQDFLPTSETTITTASTETSPAFTASPASSPPSSSGVSSTATPSMVSNQRSVTTTPIGQTTCSTEKVSVILDRFLDAFNRGDEGQLDRFIPDKSNSPEWSPPAPGMDPALFRGFAMEHFSTGVPGNALAFFQERHLVHERLYLQDLMVGEIYLDTRYNLPDATDFSIQLIREADDFAPHTVVGKGVVNCADETLLVWTTGGDYNGDVLDYSVLHPGRPLINLDGPAAAVTR